MVLLMAQLFERLLCMEGFCVHCYSSQFLFGVLLKIKLMKKILMMTSLDFLRPYLVQLVWFFQCLTCFTMLTIVVSKHARNGNNGEGKRIMIMKILIYSENVQIIKKKKVENSQILLNVARTTANVCQSLLPLLLMLLVYLLWRCCIIRP